MKNLFASVVHLVRAESGVTMIEYGLLGGLIGVVIIGSLLALSFEMNSNFNTIATSLDSTPSGNKAASTDGAANGGGGGNRENSSGGRSSSGSSGGGDRWASGGGANASSGGGNRENSRGGRGSSGSSGGGANGTGGETASEGPRLGGSGETPVTDQSSEAFADPNGGAANAREMTAGMSVATDHGPNASWAIAPEESAVAGTNGNENAPGSSSGLRSRVSDDSKGWLWLLLAFLGVFLIAILFRRMGRENERKRQTEEWRAVKAKKHRAIHLGDIGTNSNLAA